MIKQNKGMTEINGSEPVVKAEFMTLVQALLTHNVYTKKELFKDIETAINYIENEESKDDLKEDIVKSLHQIIDEVFAAEDKENK